MDRFNKNNKPQNTSNLRRYAAAIAGLGLLFTAAGCQQAVDREPADVEELPVADPLHKDRLHNWVVELTQYQPRWAGYPEEQAAGEWLAQRLRNAGIETEIDEYTMRKWELESWQVKLNVGDSSTTINSFPLWSSKGGVGTAELVDVGFGSEPELLMQDLTGKAVVVTGRALLNVFASYPDTYHRAAELGAVAMFVSSDAPDNLIRPTSTSQNYLDDNPIPAFQLGARDLASFRQAAREDGTATWTLNAEHVDGITRDIVGRLPGSGELAGTLVICAHYDAWFAGALDNATGVSGLIGLAEYFAALPVEQRPRDMIFVGVTGHDAGYPHGGITHWADKNADLIPEIDLFMNLDHLAAAGVEHVTTTGILDGLGIVIDRPGDEERALFTTQHPALAANFLPLLGKYGLLAAPVPSVPQVNANGDLEGIMGELGVPSVNLTMATPHYHTHQDTADRIPAEQLSRSVRAHKDFLEQILPLSRSQIRAPR